MSNDDRHSSPVSFEEEVCSLQLAMLIRVFQGKHPVGDGPKLYGVVDFHPPMK